MDGKKSSFTDEQISDLMKSQRRKGAERAFGYVFASSCLSALISPFLGKYLESGGVVLFSITVVVCGAAYALITSG